MTLLVNEPWTDHMHMPALYSPPLFPDRAKKKKEKKSLGNDNELMSRQAEKESKPHQPHTSPYVLNMHFVFGMHTWPILHLLSLLPFYIPYLCVSMSPYVSSSVPPQCVKQ